MPDFVVHTINGRGNVLLEVMQEYFGLSNEHMRREIVAAVEHVTEALRRRGVKYADLRNALSPQADRQEVALLFDTTRIDEAWYGLPVQRQLLPLFNPSSSHSVLLGDLLGSDDQQPWIRDQLSHHLHRSATPFQYRHSTQFYCVYVNNCSEDMVRTLDQGLAAFSPYIGYVNVTYASPFKTYLSTGLVSGYIKYRSTVIQPHEDDLPEDTNQNTGGYPFENFGLRCRSVPSTYFGLLLSYKIERPVIAGFEKDQVYSINAISSTPSDIADCTVEIDERKFEYLKEKKTGTMKRLGILGQPKAVLADLIRVKLRSNYLYNLQFRPDYSLSQFNMLLELVSLDSGVPVRVVASFAFEQERNAIRLVTLF